MTDPWLIELKERLEDRPEDLDAILLEVVNEVTRQLGADRSTLYLVEHASNRLVSRVAQRSEIAEIRLRVGEGVAGEVARTGRVQHLRRGQRPPRAARRIDEATGYHTECLLAAPVRDPRCNVIAVLQALNKEDGDFDAADVERVQVLAAQIGELLLASSLRHQLVPGQSHALSFKFNNIIGESPAMLDVYDRTDRAARTDVTVLLRGESGSGKELFSQAIHYNSSRRDAPFVKVDCAALPESLIENELFGHEKGAYTSADGEAEGKVEAAEGGTLFLDEVGELSRGVQVKLLRLLQDKTYLRIGGTRARKANVRFVCATNQNLEEAVASGTFRQDLYYRVRVVEIVVPPLRDRGPADLCRLIEHFLAEACHRHGRPGLSLSPVAVKTLHAHEWPGNVRELKNCIESAVVLAPGEMIGPQHLPITSTFPMFATEEVEPQDPRDVFVTDLRSLREVELDYIAHVLESVGGNRSAAARLLGIGRNTLLRKIKALG